VDKEVTEILAENDGELESSYRNSWNRVTVPAELSKENKEYHGGRGKY
jgi:hypothetical protein